MRGALYAQDLFEPEIVLPSQFFSVPALATERPERRLMLAVLHEAVWTLCRHAGDERTRPRRLVREVEQWVEARGSRWPFSFENICAGLNFDAGALRRGLRRLLDGAAHATTLRAIARGVGRHAAGERHRVTAPRSHHAAARRGAPPAAPGRRARSSAQPRLSM